MWTIYAAYGFDIIYLLLPLKWRWWFSGMLQKCNQGTMGTLDLKPVGKEMPNCLHEKELLHPLSGSLKWLLSTSYNTMDYRCLNLVNLIILVSLKTWDAVSLMSWETFTSYRTTVDARHYDGDHKTGVLSFKSFLFLHMLLISL